MSDQRISEREIPSFIEPRPPLILNPFMRPRPQKGTNLLAMFEEDSESEEPEWVQVYLRLKPCKVRNNLYEVKSDRCLITSVDTAPMGHGRRTQHNVSKMYTFSHIFGPESNQKEIFEQVVKDNLRRLPEGHNFTLLTYGASGSGKTYTLMGTVQAPGLVPRSLEYVFRIIDAAQQPLFKPFDGGAEKLEYYAQDYEIQFVKHLRQVSAPLHEKYRRMSVQLRNDLTTSNFDLSNRTRYFVWVSFVEIYNEAIYDLLSNCDRSKATSKLRIREDSNGNVYVKGATQAFVRSGEEAYDILVAGKHNLQVAATGVHANSSRSHCIFTITLLTETDEGVRSSCVRLCDLAGCERARHTRNTGARMQESRAINSSLHVLERCLHMLRRKQRKVDATLVPYRESKLTRLLGAGLSGARGEAVSMVVTLNPAPEYAHETKHVLQLAAVAKDIQVNQTIAESMLESSSIPDTNSTIESSAELMRLRSENERLHFELVQAESRNKELVEAMEQKQQETANTMFEIVEEAKDMTRQYYEAQLQCLRQEMEEMQEEYEHRLKTAAAHADIMRDSHTEMGTPSRSLQRKIAELMTEIAVLQENLNAEKLARARAEEEVQHLRACIEERDEKQENESGHDNDDVMSVYDSEEEAEISNDESLEPTFKKQDINRSRILQKSLMNESKLDTTQDVSQNIPSDNESIKNHTLKDEENAQDDTITDESNTVNVTKNKDSTYLSDESNVTQKNDVTFNTTNTQDDIRKDDCTTDESNTTNVTKNKDSTYVSDESNGSIDGNNSTSDHLADIYDHIKETNTVKKNTCPIRGTYVVRDEDNKTNESTIVFKEMSSVSNSIKNIRKSIQDMENSFNNEIEKSLEETVNRMPDRILGAIMEKLYNKESKSNHVTEEQVIAQFETLEMVPQIRHPPQTVPDTSTEISNLKTDKIEKNKSESNKLGNYSVAKLERLEKVPEIVVLSHTNQETTEELPILKIDTVNRKKSKYSIDRQESLEQFERLESASKMENMLQTIQENTKELNNSKINKEDNYESESSHNRDGILSQCQRLEKELKIGNTSQMVHKDQVSNLKMGMQDKYKSKSNYQRDPSLAQFEMLEKASKVEKPQIITETTEVLTDLKISKGKRNYFDEDPNFHLVPKFNKDKTYFDNINVNMETNKQLAEVRSLLDDERSPSIVKEDVTNNFEPSTIKKLLGESYTRPTEILSSVTKISLPKKQASVDIFEGFDSPCGIKPIEEPKILDKAVEVSKEIVVKSSKPESTKTLHQKDIKSNNDEKYDIFVKPKNKDMAPGFLNKTATEPKTQDKIETLGFLNKTAIEPRETSIFAKCIEKVSLEPKYDNIETTRKSMEKLALKPEAVIKNETKNNKIKIEKLSIELQGNDKSISKIEDHKADVNNDNTCENFEKIFNELSAPRATEFELLVSSSNQSNVTASDETDNDFEKPKYNFRHKLNTNTDDGNGKRDKSAENKKTNGAIKKDISNNKDTTEKRNRSKKETTVNSDTTLDKTEITEDVLLQSQAKCESKTKTKRNLRLRRRKNQEGDDLDQENEPKSNVKLRDIVNLQKEFSDVTMDVPAPVKEVMDIESPEKRGDENVPPLLGIQSCPSKSVTRSRRKLFTPRAEVLEESMTASGDSHENMRVRVPRPSYHRTRARRKL